MKKILKYGVLINVSLLTLAACNPATNRSTEAPKETPKKETFNQEVTQTIDNGKVKGLKDQENKVLEWRGIPYAKAPIGDLRWKAPEDVEDWKETLDATEYGEPAIQVAQGELKGSEDALNLDVVRPDTDETELPVVVFLHGGNNQTGHAQEIKGNTFVNDINAVYVSVNYRLGPLGFNPLEAVKTEDDDEDKSGNYTLLDVAAALDWVEENIETFGGDADNVTLTGFSAGGRDVMATLISPVFEDKFDKAISFSGGMTVADEKESQEIFATAIAPLVVEDKVKATEEEAKAWLLTADKEVTDYLYGLEAERLAGLMGNAGIRMKVFPHLYKDGEVIPTDGFDTKSYNDVPLMLVTGTNEFSLFTAFDPYFMKDFTGGTLFEDKAKHAEFLYARNYGGQFYRLANGVESARKMAGTYKSDIYITEIAYGDNEEVTPTVAKSLGAFHGVFEPLLQTPSNYESLIGEDFYNPGQEALSKQFKTYFKNFIHQGKPGDDWKPWTEAGHDVLSLDADKEGVKAEMTADKETAEDIVAKMEADTSLTADQKRTLNEKVLNGRWFSSVLDQSDFNYDK